MPEIFCWSFGIASRFKIVDPKNVLCPVSTIDSTVHKTDSVKKTDSIVIRVDSDCPQNQLGQNKKGLDCATFLSLY